MSADTEDKWARQTRWITSAGIAPGRRVPVWLVVKRAVTMPFLLTAVMAIVFVGCYIVGMLMAHPSLASFLADPHFRQFVVAAFERKVPPISLLIYVVALSAFNALLTAPTVTAWNRRARELPEAEASEGPKPSDPSTWPPPPNPPAENA